MFDSRQRWPNCGETIAEHIRNHGIDGLPPPYTPEQIQAGREPAMKCIANSALEGQRTSELDSQILSAFCEGRLSPEQALATIKAT